MYLSSLYFCCLHRQTFGKYSTDAYLYRLVQDEASMGRFLYYKHRGKRFYLLPLHLPYLVRACQAKVR